MLEGRQRHMLQGLCTDWPLIGLCHPYGIHASQRCVFTHMLYLLPFLLQPVADGAPVL
jgi:hypothetical protein